MGRVAMAGKSAGWALFLAVLFLLSFAAVTPYSHTADRVLVGVRLALVAALSVLVLQERWAHRHDAPAEDRNAPSDAHETLLQRMRRWYYGDEKR